MSFEPLYGSGMSEPFNIKLVKSFASLLPAFNGDAVDVSEFQRRFEHLAVAWKVPKEVWGMALQLKLEGKAKDAWDELEFKDQFDYAAIFAKLDTKLNNSSAKFNKRMRLAESKQGTDERPSAYARSQLKLAKIVDPKMPEADILFFIMRGLNKPLRDRLLFLKFDTALSLIEALDNFESLEPSPTPLPVNSFSRGRGGRLPRSCGRSNRSGRSGHLLSNQSNTVTCFYCHKPGHMASSCFKKKADAKRSTPVNSVLVDEPPDKFINVLELNKDFDS